jgi:L-rhamnose mutarotase
MTVLRVSSIIKLRPEKEGEYRVLHEAVWPDVLETLRASGITNYSIFLRDGMLFSYLEFIGDDYAAAMVNVASDEATKKWWKLTDPCQQPLDSVTANEWWAGAEEIFHLD